MLRAFISALILLQVPVLKTSAAVISTNGAFVPPPSLNIIPGFNVDYAPGHDDLDPITVYRLLIDALVHFSWQGYQGREESQDVKLKDEDDTYLRVSGISEDPEDTTIERKFLIEALFQITGYFCRGEKVTDAITPLSYQGIPIGFIFIVGPNTPTPPDHPSSQLSVAKPVPIALQSVRFASAETAPTFDSSQTDAATLGELDTASVASSQEGTNSSAFEAFEGANRDIAISWRHRGARIDKGQLFYALAGGLATISKFPISTAAAYMPLKCDGSSVVLRISPSADQPRDARLKFTFGNSNDAMAKIMDTTTRENKYVELIASISLNPWGPHRKTIGLVEILKVQNPGVQALSVS